jgi:hypothetical protein
MVTMSFSMTPLEMVQAVAPDAYDFHQVRFEVLTTALWRNNTMAASEVPYWLSKQTDKATCQHGFNICSFSRNRGQKRPSWIWKSAAGCSATSKVA